MKKFSEGSVIAFFFLLCVYSFVLASDSAKQKVEDDWEIPTNDTHGYDFALWNECQKILLNVSVHISEGESAERLEFSEEAVQTLFESRLRAARMFSTEEEVSKRLNDKLEQQREQGQESFSRQDLAGIALGTADALWVSVRVGVGNAYDLDLKYIRPLDVGYGELGVATIWSTGTYGVHGFDKGFIMQSLSEKADEFILKFLTVNEQACEDED